MFQIRNIFQTYIVIYMVCTNFENICVYGLGKEDLTHCASEPEGFSQPSQLKSYWTKYVILINRNSGQRSSKSLQVWADAARLMGSLYQASLNLDMFPI